MNILKDYTKIIGILIILTLTLCLFPTTGSNVAALSIDNYFSINYTIEFSDTNIQKNQSFQVTIIGEATYNSQLPLTVTLTT